MLNSDTLYDPSVMLIDVCRLNRVAHDLTTHFAAQLQRELPPVDLSTLLECMALDAGLRQGSGDVQVFLLHDSGTDSIPLFKPYRNLAEYRGKAFKSLLGEFKLDVFSPHALAELPDFYAEVLRHLLGQKAIRRLILLPDELSFEPVAHLPATMEQEMPALHLFSMQKPADVERLEWHQLGFPLLHALHIKAEELQS